MTKTKLTVLTRAGLHTRPASMIVKVANRYKSSIHFEYENANINAKSIMGIITLGAVYRAEITCICEGEDEKELSEEIKALFEKRFEEE
ncbi:MAG: HPr family phosphocarrier protein [Sphaerochaetaceae bacterium]|nr:HPr family phosphocarrier protein [Sphaerochaetaceae bacterium]